MKIKLRRMFRKWARPSRIVDLRIFFFFENLLLYGSGGCGLTSTLAGVGAVTRSRASPVSSMMLMEAWEEGVRGCVREGGGEGG